MLSERKQHKGLKTAEVKMMSTPETTRIRRVDILGESPLSNTSSPDRSTYYPVKYKDYESAVAAIQQLEAELNEFQTSSFELEKELEKELSELELDNEELKLKNEELTEELKDAKLKRITIENDFEKIRVELVAKITKLEKDLELKNSKIVDIEIMNDNIEQNERNLNTSYKELEENYHAAMERIILLDQELSDAKDQTFKEQLNYQNVTNELAELKLKYKALEKKNEKPVSTNTRPLSQTKMSKSNSIRQLHTMIEQSKGMESRIGNIKTSLHPKNFKLYNKPKSTTTTKLSNTTITTSTPAATSDSKPRRKLPLSPSSFQLSSFTSNSFAKMEKIEGSPAKPAKDFDKIFGSELTKEK